MIISSVLAFNRATQDLGNQIVLGNCGGPARFLHPFLGKGLTIRRYARRGIIQEIENDHLSIQSPHGLLTLKLSPSISADQRDKLQVGKFIIAIGQTIGENFVITKFRLIDQPPALLRGHYMHACHKK